MNEITPQELVKRSGVLTPGWLALRVLRTLQSVGQDYNSEYREIGNIKFRIHYSKGREWVTIDVWAKFPPEVIEQFWHQDVHEWERNHSKHSNSLSAADPAKFMASVNSLARLALKDVEKYTIIADVRRQAKRLPKKVITPWNEEVKNQDFYPLMGGLDRMNVKQARMMKAWFDGKLKAYKASKAASKTASIPTAPTPAEIGVAESVVATLLEDEETEDIPPEELPPEDITPKQLVQTSLGIGFKPEEFDIQYRPHRFGRWQTGSGDYSVHWKKRTRKGHPIYLGTIGRVERDVRAPTLPVAHEGQWYVIDVPSQTYQYTPRGARMKPGREIFRKKYGYGAVRYRRPPETYTRYFKSSTDAAGYLASLIKPHRHIKVVEAEMSPSEFVRHIRTLPDAPVTDKDFVYKNAIPPKLREIEAEVWDSLTYHVYAKRAIGRDRKIPWIGTIVVEHFYDTGKPMWFITAPTEVSVYSGSYGSEDTERAYDSRFEAAKVLWDHYKEHTPVKRILPPPPAE